MWLCENGQLYDELNNKPYVPYAGTLERVSWDTGLRVRISVDHLVGFYFKAPWRQFVVYPYKRLDFVNASKYYVTTFGEVFSTITWDYLVGNMSFDGYRRVLLTRDNGTTITIGIHRLVAMAFLPNPECKNEVNHLDGNKLNNNVSNLQWTWSYENMEHALHNGLRKSAISDDTIREICKLLEQGERGCDIARKLNIPVHHVKDIKAGCHARISKDYGIPRNKHFNLRPSNLSRARALALADTP